jgi:hypothetical protein
LTPATPPSAIVAPATPTPTPVPASAPASVPRDAALNVLFFEALGSGLLYSINYERFFPRWNVGLRGGASFIAYKVSDANGSGALELASLPFVASWYYGPGAHRLQLGLGFTILYVKASTDATGASYGGSVPSLGIAATAVVGYRYWPRHGGFTFGAGFTPLLREPKGLLPWGGADVGWAF